MNDVISLNQLRIGTVPEGELLPFQGKTGWELFNAQAVRAAAKAHRPELGGALSKYEERDYPRGLSDALTSGNQAAQGIAEEFGKRLGLLFYSLKAAPRETREANPFYRSEAAWDYWKGISKIQLSGGLASGPFGTMVCEEATAFLQRCGVDGLTVLPDAQGYAAPMIGCARCVPDSPEHALVFDFGQSFLKGSVAAYEQDKLAKLSTLHNVPAKYQAREYLTRGLRRRGAKKLHGYLTEQLTCCWNRYKGTPGLSCHVVISLAANLDERGCLENRGGYGKLAEVSGDYASCLGNALSEALGRQITVHLLRDGQAGANAYEPEPGKVVVTAGTALTAAEPQAAVHACMPYLVLKKKS